MGRDPISGLAGYRDAKSRSGIKKPTWVIETISGRCSHQRKPFQSLKVSGLNLALVTGETLTQWIFEVATTEKASSHKKTATD